MRVVDNVGFDVKKQDIPGGGSGSGQPLGDYVSKNGDTLNGDLRISGEVMGEPFSAGLAKVNFMGSQIPCLNARQGSSQENSMETVIYCASGATNMLHLHNGELLGMFNFLNDSSCAYIQAFNKDYAEQLLKIKTVTPTEDTHAANKKYVDDTIAAHVTDKKLILSSSTAGSTKKFEITVDDTGTLTATEV